MKPNAPAKRFEYLVKQYWDRPDGWLIVCATALVARYLFGREGHGSIATSMLTGAVRYSVANGLRSPVAVVRDGRDMTARDAEQLDWRMTPLELQETGQLAERFGNAIGVTGLGWVKGPELAKSGEVVSLLLRALAVFVYDLPEHHEHDFLLPWIARELAALKKAIEKAGAAYGLPKGIVEEIDPGIWWDVPPPPVWTDFDMAIATLKEKASPIAHWAKETKTDINRLNLAQALKAIVDFVPKGKPAPAGVTVYQFKDGYTWQELRGAEQLGPEGQSMQHCVGSYCDVVEQGVSRIYSLRDPNGSPHVTMEWNLSESDVDTDRLAAISPVAFFDNEKFLHGMIVQIYGKQNEPPAEKYKPYVIEFLTKRFKKDPFGMRLLDKNYNDFSGREFHDIDFSEYAPNLHEMKAQNSVFHRCKFEVSCWYDFRRAALSECTFYTSVGEPSALLGTFERAVLADVTFANVAFGDVDRFMEYILWEANNVKDAALVADWRRRLDDAGAPERVSFEKAKLVDVHFDRCGFVDAAFDGATMERVMFASTEGRGRLSFNGVHGDHITLGSLRRGGELDLSVQDAEFSGLMVEDEGWLADDWAGTIIDGEPARQAFETFRASKSRFRGAVMYETQSGVGVPAHHGSDDLEDDAAEADADEGEYAYDEE